MIVSNHSKISHGQAGIPVKKKEMYMCMFMCVYFFNINDFRFNILDFNLKVCEWLWDKEQLK